MNNNSKSNNQSDNPRSSGSQSSGSQSSNPFFDAMNGMGMGGMGMGGMGTNNPKNSKNSGIFRNQLIQDMSLRLQLQSLRNLRANIDKQILRMESLIRSNSSPFSQAAGNVDFKNANGGYDYDIPPGANGTDKQSQSGPTEQFFDPKYKNEMNPYIILGVNAMSTRDEVDRAWKKAAWDAHPDRGGDTIMMAKVNAAKEAIYQLNNWK